MDYSQSMDREYFKGGSNNYGMSSADPNSIAASDIQFGISAPPFDNQLQSLKTRIRQGATRVELGFTGTGKGSMGGRSTTPEMYGSEERKAIRELAQINKVELSTHATVGMTGLSGFSERGFNNERAETVLGELKRAIEFAADTAQGGAIVVHTGEWQRPVSQAAEEYEKKVQSYEKDENGNPKMRPMFSGYPDEENKGTVMVARSDTGDIQAIPKHIKVHEPEKIIEKDAHGKDVFKGYKLDENGKIKLRELSFIEAVKEAQKEHPELAGESPEVLWIRKYSEAQLEQNEAESARYLERARSDREKLERLEKDKKYYEKLLDSAKDEEEKRQISFSIAATFGKTNPEELEKAEDAKKIMDKSVEELKYHVEWEEKAALSYEKQAARAREDQGKLKPVEKVGLERTGDTLGRAALYAYDESKRLEKAGKLEKPLFIAPEAWLAEQWGSHPEEIVKLVGAGRSALAGYLQKERGLSKDDAEKVSQDHVRATLDIGHMNMWRKFIQPKPGETRDDTDKRFDKWLVDHAKMLAEKDVIGHIHVTDNFGYHDEHVTPGEGNAPIKKFLEVVQKEMVKHGKKVDFIVEPAHQDFEAVKGTWRLMGTNVYGLGGSWGGMEHSYFGRNQPAYFAIPDMLPGVQREWNTSYFGISFE